jgi:hypothetical protein
MPARPLLRRICQDRAAGGAPSISPHAGFLSSWCRPPSIYQAQGFKKIYGLAQDRLVNFWAHFGGRPLEGGRKVTFSDFSYTEMVFDIEPGPDAITIGSDPYMIIRPEGDWDRPGVLDFSAEREVTSPLRNAAAGT